VAYIAVTREDLFDDAAAADTARCLNNGKIPPLTTC
jgi:hypothetical protein